MIAQEYPILLEWYLPEVEEVDIQVLAEEEESRQQGIKWRQLEEEGHCHQHNLDSYTQPHRWLSQGHV